jgi:hypothetical protein
LRTEEDAQMLPGSGRAGAWNAAHRPAAVSAKADSVIS